MLQFKLVLLGDSSVGKSSIVQRFVKDNFDDMRESTIGAAFSSQTIRIETADGTQESVKFEIWDTAGQERYKSLAPMYYRNANAALVVYDVTQPDSLLKARNWVDELKDKVGQSDLVIFLVGNKVDIVQEDASRRAVQTDEASQYAQDQNLLFTEVSAKTGEQIKETFQQIGARLYELKKDELGKSQSDRSRNEIDISLQRPSTNDPTSCCS